MMRDAYEQASAAFVPAPDDNPQAILCYRAWAGLRAAWGAEFCEQFNSAVHNCACAAAWAQEGRTAPYAAAESTLRALVAEQRAPIFPDKWREEPRYVHSYRAEPAAPTERDAREEFNRQWRAKFPGKRCNSREANARYLELADKAMAIVRERYARDLAEYHAAEARTVRENEARRANWVNTIHGAALFEHAARRILGSEE